MIILVACNFVFYFEKNNIFKNFIKFQFKKNATILRNANLNKNIQLPATTAFINLIIN